MLSVEFLPSTSLTTFVAARAADSRCDRRPSAMLKRAVVIIKRRVPAARREVDEIVVIGPCWSPSQYDLDSTR